MTEERRKREKNVETKSRPKYNRNYLFMSVSFKIVTLRMVKHRWFCCS